jgi:L-aminopeptidase/D-esterase-like protein
MAVPGPLNLITDVAGLLVGNAEDEAARSGVTVISPEGRAVCAVDVRGGAPGTRETDALATSGLVDEVDAIVLAGGSVYGLDAASAVTAWLGARGRGYRLGGAAQVAPIVPAAILFDLANGGDKKWGEAPPYAQLGRSALEAASCNFRLGNAGAGRGARAGNLKGGLGSASLISQDGVTIGALAAVNCFGSVLIPKTQTFWAWALERGKELGGQTPPQAPLADLELPDDTKLGAQSARAHTTLGVIACDAALSRVEAERVAVMAQDGLARAIRPVHTPFDGDIVFALATGKRKLAEPRALSLLSLGALGADCMARAIARGVYEAEPTDGVPAYRAG